MRDFASASIGLWVGNPIGSSASFAMDVEESPDLEIWNALGSFSPTPGTETAQDVQFAMEWMRLEITLGGTDPAFTGWCVGDFVTRVRRE